MKVYVQHKTTSSTGGFALQGATIWGDLRSWRGIKARCQRYWPGEAYRIELLDPINIYRRPLEVREF